MPFSDGFPGVLDFAPFVEAAPEMTAPLSNPSFFSRNIIELGAPGWPNGFGLSAESLGRRLEASGGFRQDAEAA